MANLIATDATSMLVTGNTTLSSLTTSSARMANMGKNNGGAPDGTTGIDIAWNVTHENNSSLNLTESNSRFTALEPGMYYFAFRHISNNNDTTTVNYIRKNGTTNLKYSYSAWDVDMVTGSYRSRMAATIVHMDVGDYISVYRASGSLYLAGDLFVTATIFRISL